MEKQMEYLIDGEWHDGNEPLERRTGCDRRSGKDRRSGLQWYYQGEERRSGCERRSGVTRRTGK